MKEEESNLTELESVEAVEDLELDGDLELAFETPDLDL